MELQNKVIIPNGGEAVLAEYKEQLVKEYQNNPFSESLPPILTKEETIDRLAVYPPFHEEERLLDGHVRFHLIQRLFQYFQPLGIHLDLESRISRLIRQGYLARNPFKPEYARSLQEGHQMVLRGNIELTSNEVFRTTSSGLTILGASGLGKTTAINRILGMLPQVIVHSNYKGNKFSMYQLVWLKLDLPFDGSIKGLCLDFFRKVDDLLGTTYYKKFGSARQPIASMQPAMATIATNYGLGLLCIDEIQHLSTAKSQGSEKMLNFFVTLMNMFALPIVLIGTNKSMNVLQSQFRQARRGSGQGDMVWERMNRGELSWDLFVEGMWDFQWTRKPTPLTQELKDVLYDECQGITDIAVKIYAMSQVRAISTGKEEITASLIRKVAKENFRLVQPMILALKNGDIKKIAQYEDLRPIEIDAFLNEEFSSISMNQKIKELQQAKKKQEKTWKDNIKEQSILKLIELDIEPAKAKLYVESVMVDSDQELDVKRIVKEAFKLSIGADEGSFPKTAKTKKAEPTNKSDLRVIVAEGKGMGLSAHESLKEKDIIKTIENDFFRVG
ncbi:ATP-binding protein [Aneurinibacillus tyrosinisolvens]|uniref:ATP-binding protein n=1 Tax=Aneurinibacillus tyrosinisolvens TaxID=1443435 RepID=UPI00063FC415|nr:ATP-binding protein [Aneurinibacillus tyrosinisolvens]